MRVPPFYSPLRGIAVEDVWHDNDECPVGRSIAPADRIAGTAHILKHCPFCLLVDKPAPGANPPRKAR